MRVQRVRDRTKLSPRGTGKRVFDPDSDFEVFYEPQVDVKVRESEYAYPDGRRIKVGVGGRTGITRTVTFSDGKARSTTSFKRYSSEFLHQGDELVPVRLDWYTGKITREDS